MGALGALTKHNFKKGLVYRHSCMREHPQGILFMRTGKEWKYWIIERGAVDTTVVPERCTSVYVLTAVRNVKFRLSPRRDDLSTAVSASRSAGHREGTRKLGRASSVTGFRDRLRPIFFISHSNNCARSMNLHNVYR